MFQGLDGKLGDMPNDWIGESYILESRKEVGFYVLGHTDIRTYGHTDIRTYGHRKSGRIKIRESRVKIFFPLVNRNNN